MGPGARRPGAPPPDRAFRPRAPEAPAAPVDRNAGTLARALRHPRMDIPEALPPGALGARAFAKINLHLEVLRRRPDGYHEIETVMQSVGLYDTLHFVPRPRGLSLLCDTPGIPGDDSNLCMRAAVALLAAAGLETPPRGVRIDLYKRIPAAAGFGGGSADAAATLVGLNDFWGLRLEPEQLEAAAASIGSDVVFCLRGGTALARGRGEKLVMLPNLHPTTFLLVFPGVPVAAAWAYENLRMGLTRRAHTLSMDQLKTILARYPDGAQGLYNRLQDAVCPAHPVVAEITTRLAAAGAVVALMSGSGSGVFAAFRNVRAAESARRRLDRSDWRMPIVASQSKGVELFRERPVS
jgi:4-diphosphocytidyl-2-C-methyl-D-erythritol kinase